MAKKTGKIPRHALEALAEVLYPTLKEYLSSPEGKAAFKAWKERQKDSCGNARAKKPI
jgi:hypothetical protein